MKTASPVEGPLSMEIMPLDAQTEPIKIAVKLPPARRDAAPCAVLSVCCFTGNHRV